MKHTTKKEKHMSQKFAVSKRLAKCSPLTIALLDETSQGLGLAGEALATKKLESLGFDVLWCATLDVGYDLLVQSRYKVEVKTARKNCRGKFQFCLTKTEHADISKSEFIMFQCVASDCSVQLFLVPTKILVTQKQITIPGKLENYKGLIAEYKI